MDQSTELINLSDESTFELVFKTHFASLLNFANKYLEDREQAEEIVQSVFLNVWENRDRIQIKTSTKSYLLGAVRNAALNHLKHLKVQKTYAENQKMTASFSENTNYAELDELKTKINAAMDKIPEKCREIFELNRYEGKRYKEIAEMLNLSLKTVENQMGKALKILREELGEYLPLVILLLDLHGGKF